MQLNTAQIAQFEEEGYLLLRGVLADTDLDPVIAEYEHHIDRRARELLAAGKISTLYADEPFNRRLASICRECNEIYSNLDIMHFRGRASFEFLRNDNLLDIVEGLVGSEITCSPVQHTRAKLPEGLTPSGGDPHIAPWHQDAGAYVEEADPHFVLTVWLPLSAASPENGCMQIIPRVHSKGAPTALDRAWLGHHERRRRKGPRERADLADGQGRPSIDAQERSPSLDAQPHRYSALEHGPALSADRDFLGSALLPGLRRAQPLQPRLRANRLRRMVPTVDRSPRGAQDRQTHSSAMGSGPLAIASPASRSTPSG